LKGVPFCVVSCGKRIIQEGPPFVPPQGDWIEGMGGSGLGKQGAEILMKNSQAFTRAFSKW